MFSFGAIALVENEVSWQAVTELNIIWLIFILACLLNQLKEFFCKYPCLVCVYMY